jgi:hypothetical protein
MEAKKVSVVTIDTASIQRYVFASNKLKENIGASYIIEKLLYDELMIQCIRDAAGEPDADLTKEWQEKDAPIALKNDQRKAEIGYIGGGNAMVLFSESVAAREFIRLFSREVLRHFPGIQVVYGQEVATIADLEVKDKFKKLRSDLNDSMRDCRNQHNALPEVFKPGIVEDCPSSNDAAEFSRKDDNATIYISGSTQAKLIAEKQALEAVKRHYAKQLGDRYTLTNEIEKLGQKKDKGYVAIVHADGNGIGSKFMEAESLLALRKLSVQVSGIADSVMKKLIEEVVRLMDLDEADATRHQKDREFDLEKDEEGKLILPIRPILAAGDDITLVCEGRLGTHLAAEILKYFEGHKIEEMTVSACAGVAICKTHYPFFKAYHLAEELIQLSKEIAKKPENRGENGKIHSWLHFLAMPSGFNGDLDDVFESQFMVNEQYLLAGPYRLKDATRSYQELVVRLKHYDQGDEGKGWPRSKLMEMRDTFRLDESSQKLFLKEAAARGLDLYGDSPPKVLLPDKSPEIKTAPHLIYDLLQLADFYPDVLKLSPKPILHEN